MDGESWRFAPPPVLPPPGWYADPWQHAGWRWWDGWAWTPHVATAEPAKRLLPAWLSWPVVVATIPTVLLLIGVALTDLVAIPLGLVPLVIVLPVLGWLDRIEPEPAAAKWHAILWGATVAVVAAFVINTAVDLLAGEVAASLVSAPVVEEAAKGLGVWYAMRRSAIDGIMDGVVYAGWVALGFAVVEDMLYLAGAAAEGGLVEVFVLRVFLTPFAHPLFTFWTGLAIGMAVARGRPVFPFALWGYAVAVATHMLWNGTLILTDVAGPAPLLLGVVVFVGLFAAVAVGLVLIRGQDQRRFVAAVPWLVHRYGLSTTELAVFSNWRRMLAYRRRLPRTQRRRFDALHVALARLALFHHRPGPTDPEAERLLTDQLRRARAA